MLGSWPLRLLASPLPQCVHSPPETHTTLSTESTQCMHTHHTTRQPIGSAHVTSRHGTHTHTQAQSSVQHQGAGNTGRGPRGRTSHAACWRLVLHTPPCGACCCRRVHVHTPGGWTSQTRCTDATGMPVWTAWGRPCLRRRAMESPATGTPTQTSLRCSRGGTLGRCFVAHAPGGAAPQQYEQLVRLEVLWCSSMGSSCDRRPQNLNHG